MAPSIDLITAVFRVSGIVQGVGFRPFVYRIAAANHLGGWVRNDLQGVTIQVVGIAAEIEAFERDLRTKLPPAAAIEDLQRLSWTLGGEKKPFAIQHSQEAGAIEARLTPDLALCDDCLREMRDPANRRYRYPFINCTNCGPRFSIVHSLPYDRPNTTMRNFRMCPACQAEYDDPANRRFHAQPNACPVCGPHVELWDDGGRILGQHNDAITQAVVAIRRGQIVAVKGLGGFHLIVGAWNAAAVRRLRERKHREEKPFAVMFASLRRLRECCKVEALEERLLTSPQSPIVLLERLASGALPPEIAPENPYLGAMLPYTPLHSLLLDDLDQPVIATSGNVSDEPICIDEHEAVQRLHGLADVFLVHNRPIARHVDDSVVRVVMDRELVLRAARGYSPLPVRLPRPGPPVLAVGAHLKNAIAISTGREIHNSQHIGDLETPQALGAFHRVVEDLRKMYALEFLAVACDAHPDYVSTKAAEALGAPVVRVQHHYAHALACALENKIEAPALAVSWDGTGYGLDHSVWGGEFLRLDDTSFVRSAHLRPFRLPGGEQAVREPRRSALGLLYEIHGGRIFSAAAEVAVLQAFSPAERQVLQTMLAKGLNSPVTTSAGRLFDGVASLCGLRHRTSYEGQTAMQLEFAAGLQDERAAYPFQIAGDGAPWIVDWGPLVEAIQADVKAGVAISKIASRFHSTLAEVIVTMARRVGEPRVILTGGCFQNRCLTERTVRRLREAGFEPFWHRRIPPNDGGVAAGQIMAALRFFPKKEQ